MELKQYFSIVWRWLWLIVLATALGAGASYYFTSHQPKVYMASTKLLVGQSIQSADPQAQDIYTSQQLALTYIQIAKTAPVLQGTLDALSLNLTPDQLGQMSNAAIIQGTQLIQLSVLDTDPARAQALANEMAHQLTLQGPAATETDQSKRRDFVQKQLDELQIKIEQGQKTVADLQASIQVTASAREIADKQQQIQSIQSQLTQWQQSYTGLLAFLAPKSPNYLSILEPAALPRAPVGPNILQNVLVASAIGLLLALGGAFLIEYLDDTIKDPDDVTNVLGLAAIGSIARMSGGSDSRLVAAIAPRSSISEAFRVLRTNIQFSSLDRPVRSILVTSPGPMEGKSVTAANLAIVMAQAGLRTILVDCDLRKPAQHRLFGLSNDVGLTNWLIGQTALETFVRPTKLDNLRVVTTGALPPNPAEVLGSDRMHVLKEQLGTDADVVIYDSPPCLPLTDAAILARLVDGVVLIADAGRTRRDSALRAKSILTNVGGHLLGVVLNRIQPRRRGSYYYYYYYYSHEGKATKRTPTPKAAGPILSQRIRGLIRR